MVFSHFPDLSALGPGNIAKAEHRTMYSDIMCKIDVTTLLWLTTTMPCNPMYGS